MPKRVSQWVLYALLLAFVIGCGGTTNPDGGGGGGTGDETPEQPVTTLELSASKTHLPSAVDDSTDEQNQAVELITMLVSDGDNGAPADGTIFTIPTGSAEIFDVDINDNKALLFTGGDPAPRVVTVTAQHGNLQDTLNVKITGTALALTGPTELLPDGQATYTAALTNSAGEGIEGEELEIALDGPLTAPAMPNPAVTDADGEVTFVVEAGGNEGSGSITASAFTGSTEATRPVDVSRSSLQFIAPLPDARLNLPVGQPVTLTIKYLQQLPGNSTPQAVPNADIQFTSTRAGLQPGSVSVVADTTNSTGQASVDFLSDGIGTATVTATATPPGGGTPITTEIQLKFVATTPATLTLHAAPSSIGTGGDSALTAAVTDSNGNPVPDVSVQFSIGAGGQQGNVTPGSATTDDNGIAHSRFTAGSGDQYKVNAVVTSTPLVSDSTTINVANASLQLTLTTDGVAHTPGDDDGSTGDSGDTGDTGVNTNGGGTGDASGNNSASSNINYRVHYVLQVTDASGNAIELAQAPEMEIALLAFQEGEKTHANGRWQPDYKAPLNAAAFGCAPQPNVTSSAQITTLRQLDGSNWAFDVVYGPNYSDWAKIQISATGATSVGGVMIHDRDMSELVLPMATSDATAGSANVPPGQISPYGTDGDCTTLQ